MQHAAGDADAAVVPLLRLKRVAQKAEKLARYARALELRERALAAAELAQPRDSLIIAALLCDVSSTHIHVSNANPSSRAFVEGMIVKLRVYQLLHARWHAGTLFAPTAEEVAYFVENEYPALPAQMCGAFFFIDVAQFLAHRWRFFLPPYTLAEAEARLYGALRAALETDARGMLERNPCTGQAWPAASMVAVTVSFLKIAVHDLVAYALSDEAGMLLRMRACGLTAAEETALRQLAERYKAMAERIRQELPKEQEDSTAKWQQTAAADTARYGLRRCALPACNAQEPHPKLFKLCGRCRGAAYCCAAHSVEDWKRHKREDGCAAAR
jgi:hypothetical protein